MRTHRSLFVTLSFLAALLGAGASALAASTTTSTSVSVSGTVSGDSGGDTLSTSTDSSSGGGTESVSFSGDVVLRAVVTEDPDFGTAPIVVLTVDLSQLTGVGLDSGKKYVTKNLSVIQRRLTSSDALQFTFPFWPSGTNGVASSRAGGASFSLNYDVVTKTLTGASGSITSP